MIRASNSTWIPRKTTRTYVRDLTRLARKSRKYLAKDEVGAICVQGYELVLKGFIHPSCRGWYRLHCSLRSRCGAGSGQAFAERQRSFGAIRQSDRRKRSLHQTPVAVRERNGADARTRRERENGNFRRAPEQDVDEDEHSRSRRFQHGLRRESSLDEQRIDRPDAPGGKDGRTSRNASGFQPRAA